MKINFDRICRLAGVESGKERRARLTEGASHQHKMEMEKEEAHEGNYGHMEEMEHSETMYREEDEGMDHMSEIYEEDESMYREEDEGMDHMEEGEDHDDEKEKKDEMDRMDEMVEVDPKVLMEEIRRAKKMMVLKENRKRKVAKKKKTLQENHLKRVIRTEIQNILNEIDESEDSDSRWLYGNKKPKHSKKGYTNQGRLIPGIGFGKKY